MTTSSPTVYYVRSSRDAAKFYTVAENPRGYLECDCPAATFYRSRPCKHVEQVRRGCGLVARPKTSPAPEQASSYRLQITDAARLRAAALEV